MSRQQGLSLIELMIALVLGSLLTLGVLTMYLDSSETSRVSQSLARVQESGRIALDIMRRDIRMAGFAGCAQPMQAKSPDFKASNLDATFFGTGVRGVRVGSAAWSSDTDYIDVSGIEADAVGGSDVFQVRRANGPTATLESRMASPSSVIDTDSDDTETKFRIGEEALITNCIVADIFSVGDNSSVDDDQINHNSLSTAYPENSQIFHFSTNTYWVKDTGRDSPDGGNIFALYRDGNEIVSGVERLQVLYGVSDGDTADANIRFVSAADISTAQWSRVEAIRVGVLVSDDQSVMEADDAKVYDLPGLQVSPTGTADAAAVYPNDRRLRSVFASTINIRNDIELQP